MSNKSKKKQLLVKTKEPYFIHKTLESGREMTIMVGTYGVPIRTLLGGETSISWIAVDRVINELKKAFPDAHIKTDYIKDVACLVFNVSGKTVRHEGDAADQVLGDRVAKAKALAKACTIGKAFATGIKKNLEEGINRNIDIFDIWREKEKNIIRGA